jgi:uncharacterized membrane protein YhiD involved in acid resistance
MSARTREPAALEAGSDAMISPADILFRLSVAAVLGSLVGFERERLLWSAGIRTHMLVKVSRKKAAGANGER